MTEKKTSVSSRWKGIEQAGYHGQAAAVNRSGHTDRSVRNHAIAHGCVSVARWLETSGGRDVIVLTSVVIAAAASGVLTARAGDLRGASLRRVGP